MRSFLRWLGVVRTPAKPVEDRAATSDAPAPDADAIARQVVERLSEDETLRRNLTDDAFKPILDLVTSLVPGAAQRATAEADDTERVSQSARQLVQGLAAAVTSGDPSIVSADLLRRFMSEEEVAGTLRALATNTLPDAAGERAEALVGTVKSVLSRGRV